MEVENNSNVEDRGFFIVRTAPGKEDKFLDNCAKVIPKKEDSGIYAIFSPESVKGYLFVEADSLTCVVNAFRRIPNNGGVIRKSIEFAEIEKYLEKEGEDIVVNERDIVEIISGPFKGDKAKVVRLIPGKEDIVIEPISMAIPIPITLSRDDIRVIEPSNTE